MSAAPNAAQRPENQFDPSGEPDANPDFDLQSSEFFLEGERISAENRAEYERISAENRAEYEREAPKSEREKKVGGFWRGIFGRAKAEAAEEKKDLGRIGRGEVGAEPGPLTAEESARAAELQRQVDRSLGKMFVRPLVGDPEDQLFELWGMYETLDSNQRENMPDEVRALYKRLIKRGITYGSGKYSGLSEEENRLLAEYEGRNLTDSDIRQMIDGKMPWHIGAYSRAREMLKANLPKKPTEAAASSGKEDNTFKTAVEIAAAGGLAALAAHEAKQQARGNMLAGGGHKTGNEAPKDSVEIDYYALQGGIVAKIQETENAIKKINEQLLESEDDFKIIKNDVGNHLDDEGADIETKMQDIENAIAILSDYAVLVDGKPGDDGKFYAELVNTELASIKQIDNQNEQLKARADFLLKLYNKALAGLLKQKEELLSRRKEAYDEQRKMAQESARIQAEIKKLKERAEKQATVEEHKRLKERHPAEAKQIDALEKRRAELLSEQKTLSGRRLEENRKELLETDGKIFRLWDKMLTMDKAEKAAATANGDVVANGAATTPREPSNRELEDMEDAYLTEKAERAGGKMRLTSDDSDFEMAARAKREREAMAEKTMNEAHRRIESKKMHYHLAMRTRAKLEEDLADLRKISRTDKIGDILNRYLKLDKDENEETKEPLFDVSVLDKEDANILKEELAGKIEAYLTENGEKNRTPEKIIADALEMLAELRENGLKETERASAAELTGMKRKAEAKLRDIAAGGAERKVLIEGLVGLDVIPEEGLDDIKDDELKTLADQRIADLKEIRDAAQKKLDVLDANKSKPSAAAAPLSSEPKPNAIDRAEAKAALKVISDKLAAKQKEDLADLDKLSVDALLDELAVVRSVTNIDALKKKYVEKGYASNEQLNALSIDEIKMIREQIEHDIEYLIRALSTKPQSSESEKKDTEPKAKVESAPKPKNKYDLLVEKAETALASKQKESIAKIESMEDDEELMGAIESINAEIGWLKNQARDSRWNEIIGNFAEASVLSREEFESINKHKLNDLLNTRIAELTAVKEAAKDRRKTLTEKPSATAALGETEAASTAQRELSNEPPKPPEREKGTMRDALSFLEQKAALAEKSIDEPGFNLASYVTTRDALDQVVPPEAVRNYLIASGIDKWGKEISVNLSDEDLENLRLVEVVHLNNIINKAQPKNRAAKIGSLGEIAAAHERNANRKKKNKKT